MKECVENRLVDYNVWHQTSKYVPEEGFAILWFAPNGSQIHGCVVYKEKRGVIDTHRIIEWLPLTNQVGHRADVPIDYIPTLWRYVHDTG